MWRAVPSPSAVFSTPAFVRVGLFGVQPAPEQPSALPPAALSPRVSTPRVPIELSAPTLKVKLLGMSSVWVPFGPPSVRERTVGLLLAVTAQVLAVAGGFGGGGAVVEASSSPPGAQPRGQLPVDLTVFSPPPAPTAPGPA